MLRQCRDAASTAVRPAARPRPRGGRVRERTARSAGPPTAPAGTCPTACRWPGWPASTTTGRCRRARRRLPLHRRRRQRVPRLQPGRPQRDLRLRPAAVLDAIAERAARGLQFLLPVEEADRGRRAARRALPAPRLAVHALRLRREPEAIRLARHATGRALLVVFGGHYHGHIDDTLVEGDEGGARPGNLGLNPRAAADTRLVPFNDPRRSSASSPAAASPPSSPSRRSRTSASCCPIPASTRACARSRASTGRC